MKYLHSHNCYWNRSQFYKALKAGCNIFEVDVMLVGGELMLTHSWKPFKWLCYGKLESYFEKIHRLRDKELYLYIEIKTSDEKILYKLSTLIGKYQGIKILIKGIDRWFSPKREYITKELMRSNPILKSFDEFIQGKEYKRVDLYSGSIWKLWNRF